MNISERYLKDGQSLREIGRDLGIYHQKVARILRSQGVEVIPKRLPKRLVDVTCKNCGKSFNRYLGILNNDTYCSKPCYDTLRHANMRTLSTRELTNTEYLKIREKTLSVFDTCALCGSVDKLHVHHIVTRRKDPDRKNDIFNLITLCAKCHLQIKGREDIYADFFLGLVEKVGELLGSPNVKTRAISSQAPEGIGSGEGSETTRVSPNNNLSHECPPRKGRYSPNCMDNMQKLMIKNFSDNIIGFMVDSKKMKEYLLWVDRLAPDIETTKDFETKMFKQSVYSRFGFGWTEWRWIFGHNVS